MEDQEGAFTEETGAVKINSERVLIDDWEEVSIANWEEDSIDDLGESFQS